MIEINPKAVIDAKQLRIIYQIQQHTMGYHLTVTRGRSTPLEQLAIIEEMARTQNCLFSEFQPGNLTDKVDIWIEGREWHVYRWQQTWSMLLNKGVIVNPPMVAECLFDYINAAGVDKKGELIQPSPHIISDPIDFSQKIDGIPNIQKVAELLTNAMQAGAGIRYIKLEPKNGCVHCDLIKDA